ncbi:MAG TPA: CpsD/CapB family tyrosine-protein kinase [Patescibacteria group bacterium]|nr:CpsD/CapB family tyrosine-protein kinase [Patescibacteria group bacterium]
MSSLRQYIIKDREQSAVAESFRTLCSSINGYRAEKELKTVLFVSSSPGARNVMAAINTAAILAYTGKKVVLMDCDMRTPVIHEVFGVPNIGIINIIRDDKPLKTMLQPSGIAGLQILTSGPVPRRAVDNLSSPVIKEILEDLKETTDYVVINSSPLLVDNKSIVSDACILAGKADGVVMVIQSGKVRVQKAQKVLELLNGAKANIIGTVLNEVKTDKEYIYYVTA